MNRVYCTGLLSLGLILGSGISVRADSIDEALIQKQTLSKVFDLIKNNKDYKYVGVAMFKVQKGDEPSSYTAGTLNVKMAKSLENGLTQMLTPGKPEFTVLAADRIHPSQQLLGQSLPVVWDAKDKRKPNVVLTGEVKIAKDNKTASVSIQSQTAGKSTPVEIARLDRIPVDRNVLASVNQTFLVPRSVLKRGSISSRGLDEEASKSASELDQNKGTPANSSPDAPVTVNIKFGGTPVTIDSDSSSGEPKLKTNVGAVVGQNVEIQLTNKTDKKVGVVLALNGVNTIFEEDLTSKQAADCTKWVLEPNETYTIKGYYTSKDGKMKPFNVVAKDAPAAASLSEAHKGIIAVQVFTEGTTAMNIAGSAETNLANSTPTDPTPEEKADGSRGLLRAKQRSITAASRSLVKTTTNGKRSLEVSSTKPTLRTVKVGNKRELITPGEETSGNGSLNVVEFKYGPSPSYSMSIRYWNPDTTTTASSTTAP